MKDAIEKIRGMAKSFGLELREGYRLQGRDAFYLKFADGPKEVDLTLTGPVLLQLQRDGEVRGELSEYLGDLRKRCRNASPNYFLCRSGIPVAVEFQWPIEHVPNRAAGYILALATNLRAAHTITKCPLVIYSHDQRSMSSFVMPMILTNRFRHLVDLSEVIFYSKDKLPSEFPWMELKPEPLAASFDEIREFLKAKVYWLAFKQGGKNIEVWIADPWDAVYLGTQTRNLLQAAEILEAEGHIEVADEFAKPSRELLRQSDLFEGLAKTPPERTPMVWDLFVSHASEDKEGFVRPFVERLKREGVRVWYDELSLTVGDSLRRKIDEGLANSRYGIVVLSRAFFAKDWPQRELDGLVSLEIGGRKVILPIWHGVTKAEVAKFSPLLADRVAAASGEGIEAVVGKILKAIRQVASGDKSDDNKSGRMQFEGLSAQLPDDEKYWLQRKQLTETAVFKAILQKPRWRIWIRPVEFKAARFRNADHYTQFMNSSYVRAQRAPFSYPFLLSDSIQTENDWIAGEAESSADSIVHAECWALFRSAQFVHNLTLNQVRQLSDRTHVLEIFDTVVGAFTFASRMSREGVLQPRAAITFELFGVAGRELTWPQDAAGYADSVPNNCWCQDDFLGLTKVLSTEELETGYRELAIDTTLAIVAKFGWRSASKQLLVDAEHGRFRV